MAQKYNIKKRFIFSLIVISLSVSTLFSSVLATEYTWAPQTASGSHSWVDIASSADGTKLAAIAEGGYIYTSTDAGVTWTEQTSAGSRRWYVITSSSDGTKLAAANYTGYIYTSTDSGVTWTEQTGSGLNLWTSIASSADGTKLVAGATYEYIYTSTDSGVTWTQQTGAGARGWFGIASSADGTKLAAASYDGNIYTSTDSGATWTERSAGGHRGWFSIASSADGTKLAAGNYAGYIYTSTDSGVTWTLQNVGPNSRVWTGIASSSDGVKLAATASQYNGDYIYISTDSGLTWTQTGPLRGQWRSIASSSDGTKLAAVASNTSANNYIYTGIQDVDITPPTLTSFTSATANGSYGPGATINIRAVFNENLGAGSTMTVVLDTGATVTLNAVSSTTLSGTYTVGVGETSPDLTVASITSASVNDIALNNATSFTVPAAPNNIADTKAIVIENTAPMLVSFTSTTPNGTYGVGANINITANFSENLAATSTATSTMTVVLNTGVSVDLNVASSTALSGTYTVLPGNSTSDLTVSSITSASVYDMALNNATSFTVPAAPNNIANTKAIVINTPPTLTSFTSATANGSYGPGATINIRAVFNENLGAGSTMTVVLDTGATVTLNAVSGTRLNGTYTVGVGETSPDLTVASITSASVNDIALNNATSFSVPAAPNNIANVKAIKVN